MRSPAIWIVALTFCWCLAGHAAETPKFFGVPVTPKDPALIKRFTDRIIPVELIQIEFNLTEDEVRARRPKLNRKGDRGFRGRENKEHLGFTPFFQKATYVFNKGLAQIELAEGYHREAFEGAMFPASNEDGQLAYDGLAAILGDPDLFGFRDFRPRQEGAEQVLVCWRKPEAEFLLSMHRDEDDHLERSLRISRPGVERYPPPFDKVTFAKVTAADAHTQIAAWLKNYVKAHVVDPYFFGEPGQLLMDPNSYDRLPAENGLGFGFAFVTPSDRRYVLFTPVQAGDGDSYPKTFAPEDYKDPMTINGLAVNARHFKVLSYDPPPWQRFLHPLLYDPEAGVKVGDIVYIYPEQEPMRARVVSVEGGIQVEAVKPFATTTMAGSPLIKGTTNSVIGVFKSADAQDNAKKAVYHHFDLPPTMK